MNNLETIITDYLDFCQYQKRLDAKTLKAYKTDLKQFKEFTDRQTTVQAAEAYISMLHQVYRPKTSKRKIASLKTFFHYLEYKDIIKINPMNKIQTKFREPATLPKTIPLHTIETLLSFMYKQKKLASNGCQAKYILRDIAVVELLFSTGIRVSELCSLKQRDIDLCERSILIYGKHAKERKIQLVNNDVLSILYEYQNECADEIQACGWFFTNRLHKKLSEQSVREIINSYYSVIKAHL